MNSISFFPVWSTLIYFDIFRYPLREDEIARFCHGEQLNRIEIRHVLNELITEELVYQIGDYYCLRNDPELIVRRESGNARAINKWEKARSYSKLMSRFPFVRAVWISGSLSKDFMDEHSDIDYFIITKPGRLWLTRTFLILFKKIFLLNSHKNFCVNYFIDEENLQIKDKNLFTATELLTLRPLTNEALYEKFLAQNPWTNHYLPGYRALPFEVLFDQKKSKSQKTLEYFLDFLPLKNIDSFFMNFTKKYWSKKFNTIPDQLKEQQLRSEKNVSKHHPQGYQNKVMKVYNQRIQQSPDWIVNNMKNEEVLA